MGTFTVTFIPRLGGKFFKRASLLARRFLDRIRGISDICPHLDGTHSLMCDYPELREKHHGHHRCPKGRPCFLRAPQYAAELEQANEKRINLTRYGVPDMPSWAKKKHF
jgi:hypothetical protein